MPDLPPKPYVPKDFHRDVARRIVDTAFPKFTPNDKGALMRVIVRALRDNIVSATSDIEDFHVKFGLTYDGPPRALDKEASEFRAGFMQEELDEYRAAVYSGDLASQFDALIDLIYVALGTAYLQGFPFGEGWKEVHRANMSKVRAQSAEESKRSSSLDVVKPANFVPPDIDAIIERRQAYFEAKATGWKDPEDEGR